MQTYNLLKVMTIDEKDIHLYGKNKKRKRYKHFY